jgi:hypothetical protein
MTFSSQVAGRGMLESAGCLDENNEEAKAEDPMIDAGSTWQVAGVDGQ